MSPAVPAYGFARRLLAWWRRHGRHDLPWQHPRTPYRVWVSEIMLQQTRAETVVPYFRAFMARFPDLPALAGSSLDEVLARWSGLGYYARARNLHAAARICMAEHGGRLPATLEELQGLPGIGRSTAAAIAAQAFDRPAAILDGNARRVLVRHAGVEGWPGRPAVERRLWSEAEARTPPNRARDYAQAVMDLGATVCTPRAPACGACPVDADCQARLTGRAADLPTPRPRRRLPQKTATFFIIEDADRRVLLARRPPAGIWGGLWCLPEHAPPVSLDGAAEVTAPQPRAHTFTHFRLTMRFRRHRVDAPGAVREADGTGWFHRSALDGLGLPRPVRQVLESL